MEIKKRLYYLKRCGAGYIINRFRKNGAVYSQQKLHKYFENLPESCYEKELKEYIRVFVPNGEKYNIDEPVTFNEKIQWLKLHDTTPLKVKLADKYAVREWVKEKIGEEYLVPLVGGPWTSADEINFEKLPDQFALKANHGSAMNIIVKDKSKLNYDKTRKTANSWMKKLYGWNGMEIQYFDIPRMIIAEKYIEQNDGNLLDYKIYCFNGKPRFFQIIGDRNLKIHDGKSAFYDTKWNRQKFNSGGYPEYEYELPKPENFEKLIEIAKILSADFKYVRVDLYEVDGKIYFGEMTFTPANGFLPWKPEKANYLLGKMIDLNK